jgi:hypothetical protein
MASASPAFGAAVTLQPAQAAPGHTITIRGSGFVARSRATIVLAGRPVRTLRVGPRGAFVVRLKAPKGRSRAVLVTASAAGRRLATSLRVLNRDAAPTGAKVVTSKGAEITVATTEAPAGGPVAVSATGLRGRTARLWFPGGRVLVLRGNRAGRASGRLTAPGRPSRTNLYVSVDGVTTALAFVVKPAPAPGPGPGPAPGPSPPPSGAPRLVATGDVACAPGSATTPTRCRHGQTAALARSLGPNAIAAVGDLQYETGSLSAFQSSFGPTWGAAVGPLLRPVPGNHEYQADRSAGGYFGYFGSRAGDPAKGYYSYDLGTWHVIAVNTNSRCSDVPCGAGSPQEAWLRSELASHTRSCTLVYWHHPRFSSGAVSGSDSQMNALWVAAYQGGADVVINGHEHIYERFAPLDATGQVNTRTGLREFIAGTGGKDLHPLATTPKPGSEVRINDAFGVLELTLRPTAYDWRYVVEGGAVRDSGTQACR